MRRRGYADSKHSRSPRGSPAGLPPRHFHLGSRQITHNMVLGDFVHHDLVGLVRFGDVELHRFVDGTVPFLDRPVIRLDRNAEPVLLDIRLL